MSGAQRLLQDFVPRMAAYQEARDYPGRKGVSHLSVHLRFGTVSIRQLARLAAKQAVQGCEGAQTWLSNWPGATSTCDSVAPPAGRHAVVQARVRPRAVGQAPALWQAWREARTGYLLVDAAMRQLLQTGYMHNRLRMVVASFLTRIWASTGARRALLPST